MSNDGKKKVVLGSTLALLLGAGSYWFLGSGGRDSDGLNASPPAQKAIRPVSAGDPKTQKGDRPKHARNESWAGKGQRNPHAAKFKPGKRRRDEEKGRVKIKKIKPRPAA